MNQLRAQKTRRHAANLLLLVLLATPAFAAAPVGVDIAAMDRGVAPGNDFYRFANGRWMKRTAIPADQSNWGSSPLWARKL